MRRFTYKAAAGFMAAAVMMSNAPVGSLNLLTASNNVASVQAASEDDTQETEGFAEGIYSVPISLTSAAPLPPVQTAFATAFGENGVFRVDAEGNKTLTVNNQQMVVDFSIYGGGTFYANITSLSYYDADNCLQPATVNSTKESQWSQTSDISSDEGVPLIDITVPDEVLIPLISDTEGTYKLSCTCDFMDNLMGKEYALDATLIVDLESAISLNTSALTSAIEKAESYTEDELTSESYEALTAAINTAKEMFDTVKSQEDIDSAAEQLQTVIDSLRFTKYSLGTGDGQAKLEAGTYSVPVTLKKADLSANSMAASCINGPGTLVIDENGNTTLSLSLQAVNAYGIVASASDWKVYDSYDYKNETSTTDCEVVSTDDDGKPTKISFALPYTDKNEIFCSMHIDAMGLAQTAAFSIDWKSAAAIASAETIEKHQETIDAVEAELAGLNESDYTVDSYKELADAIAAAKEALEKNESPEAVEAAMEALAAAKANLTKVPETDTNSGTGTNNGTDNNASTNNGTDNNAGTNTGTDNNTGSNADTGSNSGTTAVTVSTPASVKAASASYKKIKISWKKVSGADGYEVYKKNSKNKYVKVNSATGTSYTQAGLKAGTKYYFKVRAYKVVDGTKVYSSYTKVVSAKPVPAKTAKITAKNTKKKAVVITWKKVAGANGYTIYRATKKNGKYKAVATVKKGSILKYTNKNLKKGTKYYYKVKAYRKVNGKKVYGTASSATSVKIKR